MLQRISKRFKFPHHGCSLEVAFTRFKAILKALSSRNHSGRPVVKCRKDRSRFALTGNCGSRCSTEMTIGLFSSFQIVLDGFRGVYKKDVNILVHIPHRKTIKELNVTKIAPVFLKDFFNNSKCIWKKGLFYVTFFHPFNALNWKYFQTLLT